MHIFMKTERMVLRRFTADDVDLLVELDSDPDVMRYISSTPTPRAEVETRVLPRILSHYDSNPDLAFWAAISRETDEFLGWFLLRPHPDTGEPELGYRLRQAAWGKGYATEGARALVRKAFTELGVERIWAETMAVNNGSRHVLEKAGLVYEKTVHLEFKDPVPGHEHGEVFYGISREEWLRNARLA